MIDIILHKYENNPVENLSIYNVPHKFRVAKKNNFIDFSNGCLKLWDTDKNCVLNKLSDEIKKNINQDKLYAIAVAPSNTQPFNKDIHEHLIRSFPNTIDLTSCISKCANFESIKQTTLLSDEELKKNFTLDPECLKEMKLENIKTVLLVDDVYSKGNTFKGMELLIAEILPNVKFIKAVILSTS